jgi:hypothetical protein
MSPKTEKLTETVEKINEKHGEKTVLTANKLSEKDNSVWVVSQKTEKFQEENLSVFETLSRVDVNDKIESKNKMKYLSWAYAWLEAKKRYPNANYKVYETETGINYFTDQRTCWVKTGVTINGLEHIEYLPVLDFRNQSIPINKVTSFDVNKSIQRSLTKALARHGLGLYIYAGEDLPESEEIKGELKKEVQKEPPKTINKETEKELETLISEQNEETSKKYLTAIFDRYKIYSLSELTQKQALVLIERLKGRDVKTA